MKRERAPRKKPRSANLEPVIVVWEDAHHDIEFDGRPEDASGSVLLNEIGFLVRNDKKLLILGNETYEDVNKEMTVRGVVSIPASLVRSITFLEPKKTDGETV